MKRIINYKHFVLYLLILITVLFMVFYRYIDYAYKTPSRMQNAKIENWDGPKEEFYKIKNNNFFQNFVSLKSNFGIDNTYIDYSTTKMRVIPILIVITLFIYSNIKKNLIKYNIGRNSNYEKEKNKLKRKVSLITPIFSAFSVILLVCIGLISTNDNFGDYFRFSYNHGDIINHLMFNNVTVLIVFEFFSFVGLYLLNLFVIELMDRYGKIDSIIIFLILLWIVPVLLPSNDIFFGSISGMLPHSITLFGLKYGVALSYFILPITILGLAIFWIRKLNKNEVEI